MNWYKKQMVYQPLMIEHVVKTLYPLICSVNWIYTSMY